MAAAIRPGNAIRSSSRCTAAQRRGVYAQACDLVAALQRVRDPGGVQAFRRRLDAALFGYKTGWCLAAAAIAPMPAQETGDSTWTVLLYAAVDNDWERPFMGDLRKTLEKGYKADDDAVADPEDFRRVKTALPNAPLFVGSGVDESNLTDFWPVSDGMPFTPCAPARISRPPTPEIMRII